MPTPKIEQLAQKALSVGWQQILIDDVQNMTHTLTSIRRVCQEAGANSHQTKALVDLLIAVRTEFLTMANNALR